MERLVVSAEPDAFKRAAESLEKLMDATREELSDTMAAVRLSGMEISDLTMSSVTMVPIRNSSASDLASSWR
ncbi:hypothetical protein SASPL_141562 [Salvia splendens]|uniref:Uncharacterized protein n=1 Tax=Salvia splendens TaxID=180675 RepID=A0A8X8WTX0_SALSN|nr:hypothetical protein SASPL_141562 [Salvia splendens]